MKTKTYTIVETIEESFNIEVPADLEGDELGDYIENARTNSDHKRRFDGLVSVAWWEQ